jgi:ketosteroid isomerase-like protein
MPATVQSICAATLRRGLAMVAMLACIAGSPAAAQDIPGGNREDFGRGRLDFNADALRDFNRFTAEWAEAWTRRDLRSLLSKYSGNPTIILGDSALIRGQIELRRFFERELPAGSEIRLSIGDFAAGEGLSYASGAFVYQSSPEADPSTGTYVLVLSQEGGRMKIRMQMLTPAPVLKPAAPPPAPAAP